MGDAGGAIEAAYSKLLYRLEPERENFFAMLLIDGLSRREEEIVVSANAALDEVPIFGASAGDNLSFENTQIFLDGQVLEDAALVVIGASSRRVEVFKCEHFRPTDCKMVVTEAEPRRRIVHTINAEPAAAEYARLIGVAPDDLGPEHYAANPLLVRIAGDYHIRAIQKVDEDGALHFYCAVDRGSVLTLALPEDLRDNLIEHMERLSTRLDGLEITLCFDCILRRLEVERLGIKPDLLAIFRAIQHGGLQHLWRAISLSPSEPDPYRTRNRAPQMKSLSALNRRSPDDLMSRMESLEQEVLKLRAIRDALIDRVDRGYDFGGAGNRGTGAPSELDVSVEKRIQRLARAMSEAKVARGQLQQAIDSIDEGFILYDKADRVVLCNRKYRTLFPELADILHVGTSFHEIISRAAEAGVVSEAVTDPQAWIAARTGHHRQECSQFQQLLSDGRWIQISDRKTDEGGTVTIVSDITHFKRLEEARRLTQMAEEADLLVRTVASIAQGVVVLDTDLRLVAWNSQAAMLLNLPFVEMHPGMGVRELVRLAWRHGASLPVERKLEARKWIGNKAKRYPLRLELLFPGGRCVAANFLATPIIWFAGTPREFTSPQALRVVHMFNHQTHHRGQIHALLTGLGSDTGPTDIWTIWP